MHAGRLADDPGDESLPPAQSRGRAPAVHRTQRRCCWALCSSPWTRTARSGELAAAFGLACMVSRAGGALAVDVAPRSARLAPILALLRSARPVARLRGRVDRRRRRADDAADLLAGAARHAGESLLGLAGVAAFWALPVLCRRRRPSARTSCGPGSSTSRWRAMIGLTVQALVSALAGHADNVARVASAARSVLCRRRRAPRDLRRRLRCVRRQLRVAARAHGRRRPASTAMAGLAAEPMTIDAQTEPLGHGLAFTTRRPSSPSRACTRTSTGAVGGARPTGLDALRARPARRRDGRRPRRRLGEPVGRAQRRPGADRPARDRGRQRHRPRRSRRPARRAGRHRPAHRAGQPPHLGRRARPRPARRPRRRGLRRDARPRPLQGLQRRARPPRRRPPAQGMPRPPGRRSCAPATSWPASAARSSPCCCRAAPWRRRGVVERLRAPRPPADLLGRPRRAPASSRPRRSWPAPTTRSTPPSTPAATSCSPPEAPQPAGAPLRRLVDAARHAADAQHAQPSGPERARGRCRVDAARGGRRRAGAARRRCRPSRRRAARRRAPAGPTRPRRGTWSSSRAAGP